VSRWLLKAAAQKALSFFPARHSCNYLFQKHVTRSIALESTSLKYKVDYARRHLQIWTSISGVPLDGIHVLELGTGWYPVLPIVFYLCGAAKVSTIDKAPLLRRINIIKTIQLLTELLHDNELFDDFPWIRRDRVENLRTVSHGATSLSLSELLARLNIEALVQDARCTNIPQGSVQFLLSNSVLQEIPKDVLFGIFREFRRMASRDSTMIHYINMVEPFVGYDPTITAYHFLQFSESAWKCINNPLHFHNRLRMPDYRDIHTTSGFRILSEDNEKGPDSDLDGLRLAAPFAQYPREDLRILRTWIVSQVEE
jgi:hypothetical protein